MDRETKMATSNKQKDIFLLIGMAVVIGLLIFVRKAWQNGQLTVAMLGLVGALFVGIIVIATVKNWDDLRDWFPDFISAVGDNWAKILGSVFVTVIVILASLTVWDMARAAAGNEKLTTPIASPTARTAPTSMEEVFRGKSSRIVVYRDRPTEYVVGPNLKADFTAEGDRPLLTSWEEKRGADKVRFYAFQAGTNPGVDSMVVRVCEYPETIETAVCIW
ncbi:MAG: hypothetical protein AAB690_02590 [Patescibacteria group bacterium]